MEDDWEGLCFIDNEPYTPEQWEEADKEYRRISKSQADCLREIRRKLKADIPLTKFERDFAAAALEMVEKQMPTKKPRPAGQRKLPRSLAMDHAVYINNGGTTAQFKRKVADEYSCSEEAVQKALDREGKDKALRFIKNLKEKGK